MTHLLDESMRQILSKSRERVRIVCFEWTGCLLRLLPMMMTLWSGLRDSLNIKSQLELIMELRH